MDIVRKTLISPLCVMPRGTDEDLIFVSTDDSLPAMATFFKELGIELNQPVDTEGARNGDRAVAAAAASRGPGRGAKGPTEAAPGH